MQVLRLFRIVFFLFVIALNSFEVQARQVTPRQDSLVLLRSNSDRRIVVKSGRSLKLWLIDKNTEIGELKSLNGDTLILERDGLEQMFSIYDIKKLKVKSSLFGQNIGGAFVVFGIGGMVLGGITLLAGTAALINEDIGAVVLVATPVLLGGGFGIYKLGTRITGKKFKLQSKWSIAPATDRFQ